MTRSLNRPVTRVGFADLGELELQAAAPTVGTTVAAASASSWPRQYARRLLLVDTASAVAAVAIGFAIRVGFDGTSAVGSYFIASLIVAAAWLLCLHAQGAYEVRRIANGTTEFQRVIRAAAVLAGGIAILGYLAGLVVGRTFVGIVIPTGMVLMIGCRYAVRRDVCRLRMTGAWSNTILAVGTRESVTHLAEVTRRANESGLIVVGACVEDAAIGEELLPGVPVVGGVLTAAETAEQLGVDIVAVAASGLGPRRIRELGWALEGSGRNMVLAPGLTEVAGPRVHVSPVEGLPLMWVDQPRFTGVRQAVKRGLDLFGALLALLVFSPVLVVVALAVQLTSRGSAFYLSERMGQDGRRIRVYKFRSMYRDADARRSALLSHNESEGGVLFKMRSDPRVTPIGRIIRKFSLDELPQLLNVVNGSMSLVGPRPPLPTEVERYRGDVHRRLLVKPGMTGLWQVSGRSDLSWDESVRLDLYYVENWSLTMDLVIIAKTIWAVARSRGAY